MEVVAQRVFEPFYMWLEKNRRNTKTFLNIFGLVVIIITIVSFIFIF